MVECSACVGLDVHKDTIAVALPGAQLVVAVDSPPSRSEAPQDTRLAIGSAA